MKTLILMLIILVLAGCNRPTSSTGDAQRNPTVNAQGVYPHTAEFKSKTHGKMFIQNRTLCAKCHGDDFRGGQANVSCQKCHAGFPHASDWGAPTNHGVEYLKLDDDKKQQCQTCHTPDKGVAGISCQSCHTAFPHSDEFIAGGHSALFRSSEGKCLTCHDHVKKDLPDMAAKVSCQTCHMANFPHPSKWALPSKHGTTFEKLSPDDKKQCFGCHTGDKPSSGISCQQCHKAFPHNEDFINGGHAALAKTFDGKCLICHEGYKKNMPNVGDQGCRACHAGNIDIGWKGNPQARHLTPDQKKAKESRKPTSR